MKFIKSLAALAALGLFSMGTANAGVCAISDVTTSTACENKNGNDKGNDGIEDGNQTLFGVDGWLQSWSSDGGLEAGAEDFGVTGSFSTASQSGAWKVASWNGFSEIMMVVKAGNVFAAYLIDTTAGFSGTWSTAGLMVGGGNQPDLSHFTLYYRGVPEMNEVPLPAAGWLMLAGAAGLGFAGRRRKAA